jgi:signal transduction histidine kinase
VRAQQLLVEGRNRVKDLRVLQANSDLAETIIQRASELTADGVPSVQLMQEGSTRSLHPLVAVEVQRIAEEAITNAIAHAQASNVEIMLCWGRRELRLAVRDDGIGMPRSIVKNGGRDGHFGIIGMRERAERIGGVLSLTSRKSMGTEIALAVPARAAYNDLEIGLRDRIKRFIVRIVMPDV